MLDTR